MRKYVIIAENDESKWEDQTGNVYHFPTKYINKLTSGSLVIYYKGSMKKKQYLSKRMSPDPHYFAMARIGEIYKDEENDRNYYAEILDYISFPHPVAIKEGDNYLERIPESRKNNYWRDGVRLIDEDIYKSIIIKSGLVLENMDGKMEVTYNESDLPMISEINIQESMYPLLKIKSTNKGEQKENMGIYTMHSKNAKVVGDRGEQIVIKFLEERLNNVEKSTLRWVANLGEKPGYDIEYIDRNGNKIGVEVKSTVGKSFESFNITSNELFAAKSLKANYHLYLVAECLSESPKVQNIGNLFLESEVKLEPLTYKVCI